MSRPAGWKELLEEERLRLGSEEEARAALAQAFERGRREGFEQGYRAASSTITGEVHGVIKAAEAFMAELRALTERAARYGVAVELVDACLKPADDTRKAREL